MRMDEVAEVSGGDLKCSKHLASLRLRTGEAGIACRFYMSHETRRGVRAPQLSKLRQDLAREHVLPFTQASPLFSSHFSLIYLETSLFPFSATRSPFILIPFLSVSLCVSPGQVCPCVASSNRKCILDVTFLSISMTKSCTSLCSKC